MTAISASCFNRVIYDVWHDPSGCLVAERAGYGEGGEPGSGRSGSADERDARGDAADSVVLRDGIGLEEMRVEMRRALRREDVGRRVVAHYLLRVHEDGLYRLAGFPSIVALAQHDLDIGRSRCWELIRVASELRSLRHIDEAFAAGKLSWSRVQQLTRVVTPDHEKEWLELALALPLRQFQREIRGLEKGRAPRSDRKGLPEVKTRWSVEVDAETREMLELAEQKLTAMRGGEPVDHAELLRECVRLFLKMRPTGDAPGWEPVDHSLYTLIVDSRVGGEARADESGTRARDMVGDTEVVDLADLEPAEPLDPSNPTPPKLRQLVLARDGRCCRACESKENLNAHHIEWRSRGGLTTASNLLTLCESCHALVHTGYLEIEGDAEGAVFRDRFGNDLQAPRTREDAGTPLSLEIERGGSTGVDRCWSDGHFGDGGDDDGDQSTGDQSTGVDRPGRLDEVVGQTRVVRTLRVAVDAACARDEAVPHCLFTGPPGLGKTSLARTVAAERGARCHTVMAPLIREPSELLSALHGVRAHDVLFLDEIHALPRRLAESLYEAMEDGVLSLPTAGGAPPAQRRLPPFTLIGATTAPDLLPEPMAARFPLRLHLERYSVLELTQIAARAAERLGLELSPEAAEILASASRGTPRETLALIKCCRDLAHTQAVHHAQSEGNESLRNEVLRNEALRVDAGLAQQSLDLQGIDEQGLLPVERQAVALLREERHPIGAPRLAHAVGLPLQTWLRCHEPYLIDLGLLQVTERGRVAGREEIL